MCQISVNSSSIFFLRKVRVAIRVSKLETDIAGLTPPAAFCAGALSGFREVFCGRSDIVISYLPRFRSCMTDNALGRNRKGESKLFREIMHFTLKNSKKGLEISGKEYYISFIRYYSISYWGQFYRTIMFCRITCIIHRNTCN